MYIALIWFADIIAAAIGLAIPVVILTIFGIMVLVRWNLYHRR